MSWFDDLLGGLTSGFGGLGGLLGMGAYAYYEKGRRDDITRSVTASIESAAGEAETTLTEGADEAETLLNEGFDAALDALNRGNANAAQEILKGLGLSTEELEKWVDVATNSLQWIVDFGQEAVPISRAYMKEMSKLIMNPDAIYESNAWQAHKGAVMDAVQNSASARSGLTNSNTLAAMSDKIGAQAMNFRQAQLGALQQGYSNAASQIGLGAQASQNQANLQANLGTNLANMYTNAYNQLGANQMALGAGESNLQTGLATGLANIRSGLSQNLANVGMGAAANTATIQMANAANSPFADLAKIYAYNMGQQNMLTKDRRGATAGLPSGLSGPSQNANPVFMSSSGRNTLSPAWTADPIRYVTDPATLTQPTYQ